MIFSHCSLVQACVVVCVKDDDKIGWGRPEVFTQSIPIHPLLVGVPIPAMCCVSRFCVARPLLYL